MWTGVANSDRFYSASLPGVFPPHVITPAYLRKLNEIWSRRVETVQHPKTYLHFRRPADASTYCNLQASWKN